MSAPELREAASLMRERAEAATEGPWIAHDCSDSDYNTADGAGWWWVWRKASLPYYGGVMEPQSHAPECRGGVVGICEITDGDRGTQERADAEHVAGMDPIVADLVAAWLDSEADRLAELTHAIPNVVVSDGVLREWGFGHALDVARAYLGGAA